MEEILLILIEFNRNIDRELYKLNYKRNVTRTILLTFFFIIPKLASFPFPEYFNFSFDSTNKFLIFGEAIKAQRISLFRSYLSSHPDSSM